MTRGDEKRRSLKSGTTVLAFRYPDGIVCAGDRMLDLNDGTIITDYQKIMRVTEGSLWLASGTVHYIQEIHDLLAGKCQEHESEYKRAPTVREQATMLVELCRDTEKDEDVGMDAILAGVDDDGAHRMYRIDEDGVLVPFSRYSSCGSGGEAAAATLDLYWKRAWLDGLDLPRSISLAVRAMSIAALHDSNTTDPRLAVPTVAVISDAARHLAEDEVAKVCERLFKGDAQLEAEIAADERLRLSRAD